MNNSHRKVRMLTEGALCIALAEILSFLPLYKMPWGGSVDLSMLPIILFCVRWGFGPGTLVRLPSSSCGNLSHPKRYTPSRPKITIHKARNVSRSRICHP